MLDHRGDVVPPMWNLSPVYLNIGLADLFVISKIPFIRNVISCCEINSKEMVAKGRNID